MADLQRQEFFLNLPDEFLLKMFKQLPVVDLLKCKLLCQRFKGLIEAQSFWKAYLQKNYIFEQVSKGKAPDDDLTQYNLDVLAKEWYCFWDNSNEIPPANDRSRFVFKPFPQMWTNSIITPDTFSPFAEESRDYCAFHKAIYLLLELRRKCELFQVTSTPYCSTIDSALDVCLFPWKEKELPQPNQVLEIFHTHEEIIRLRSENEEHIHVADRLDYELDEYFEDETDYERDITLLNNTFSSISENEERQEELFQWLQNLFQPSLMFCAGKDAIHPQMYFHLTFLSPGWVGGAFTTISLV